MKFSSKLDIIQQQLILTLSKQSIERIFDKLAQK
jgi:hypothetical protein